MLRHHLYQNISPALQNEKNTANSPLSNSSASVCVTVPDCFSVLDIYLLYYKPQQMRNSLSLQFFWIDTSPSQAPGYCCVNVHPIIWMISMVCCNLALNYEMTLRSHTESSFHSKTQSCVFLMPYIGMISGNVMWCDTVYASVGLTHNDLWPLCSFFKPVALVYISLSLIWLQSMIHSTVTHPQIWNTETTNIHTHLKKYLYTHSHRYVMKYIDRNHTNHLYKHVYTHSIYQL